jgi:hypothetical protein
VPLLLCLPPLWLPLPLLLLVCAYLWNSRHSSK